MLDRVAWLTLLNDFYGQLLTDRQRRFLELHYENDLSLGEIARDNGISRPAVHDSLKRAEAALEAFESKLGLVRRFLSDREKIEEVAGLIESLKEECPSGKLEQIKGILKGLL
jgi:predicted DNA-binding protein YlxM (UPF0122 family)